MPSREGRGREGRGDEGTKGEGTHRGGTVALSDSEGLKSPLRPSEGRGMPRRDRELQ